MSNRSPGSRLGQEIDVAFVTVGNTAGLLSALALAKSGDTILLKTGAYSNVHIKGRSFEGGVTIASVDPEKPAVLKDLTVRDSSGIALRNLEFVVDPAKLTPFLIYGSKNIELSDIDVHGSLNGNPADDSSAVMIRNSSNVVVERSEFHELQHGISFLDSSGLRLSDNSFHDIRTDGIRGGGTSNIVIDGNSFTDFYPGKGDHPDAIQLWTTGTTASASNITITDNVFTRGDGAVIQGIFLRDEVGTLPFENVTITGNVIRGGMYNGITVAGGNHVTITDNEVVGFKDMKSWIRVDNGKDVTVADNTANEFVYSKTPGVAASGNVKTALLALGSDFIAPVADKVALAEPATVTKALIDGVVATAATATATVASIEPAVASHKPVPADERFYNHLFHDLDVDLHGGRGSVVGNGVNDNHTEVKTLHFLDGDLTFDDGGAAAQVFRMYDALLHRAPDAMGLDNWVDAMRDGATIETVAAGFVNSDEFRNETGNLSNGEFVDYMYAHALGRAPDAGGRSYWIDALDNGLSRAALLVGFSESPEHRATTAAAIAEGLFIPDDSVTAVTALYDTFTNRLPDRDGLIYWSTMLDEGKATLSEIAQGFANSGEFQSSIKGLSHAEIVDNMYLNTLDRPAEAEGRAFWTAALDNGASYGSLILGFAMSLEHRMIVHSSVADGAVFL